MKSRTSFLGLLVVATLTQNVTHAQSPELSMREFASGQVKKGVRSIGFGGDGATWGNYGLVWKDAGTALVDVGDTDYTNGNNFRFDAVGATTPRLWHDLTVYAIALRQNTDTAHYMAQSPGFGPAPVAASGHGNNNAQFLKAAMPLGNGFSAGILLSHEVSDFTATSDANPSAGVRYRTTWRPSGGFGLAWQPDRQWLIGFRALLNRDLEQRADATGIVEGVAKTNEFRLGASYSPWAGGQIDMGSTRLYRRNGIAGTDTTHYAPNLGFEQSLRDNSLAFRFGLDESSPGAGFSAKFTAFKLDVAYIRNLGKARVGELFGDHSSSLIMTLNWDYEGKHPPR
jgi:hypothetical protein